MDYVQKLEQMLQRLFDNLGCDHDDEFDDQMEQALWKINQLNGVDDAAVRAMEAWDCTVLPVSNDGMMQDRMESLRAALVPNASLQRRAARPVRCKLQLCFAWHIKYLTRSFRVLHCSHGKR